MKKDTPQHVRKAYEQYIRAYNAHDSREYWDCFHWPHTTIVGSGIVVHDRPTTSLEEKKQQCGYTYQQIITLQVMAYSEHTAHVVVRLACLDAHKKMVTEHDMVYIYKHMHGAWKIYVVSEVDSQITTSTNAHASSM